MEEPRRFGERRLCSPLTSDFIRILNLSAVTLSSCSDLFFFGFLNLSDNTRSYFFFVNGHLFLTAISPCIIYLWPRKHGLADHKHVSFIAIQKKSYYWINSEWWVVSRYQKGKWCLDAGDKVNHRQFQSRFQDSSTNVGEGKSVTPDRGHTQAEGGRRFQFDGASNKR